MTAYDSFLKRKQLDSLIYSASVYESIEHADDTVVRFRNEVCFKNWK